MVPRRRDFATVRAGIRAQQLRHILGRHRTREVEALPLVALPLSQQLAIILGLDSLGDRPQSEIVREPDDRAHHGEVARITIGNRGDEGAVDLQLLDRQRSQIAERRGTRSEVVERQPDAERTQPLEHLGVP